MWVSREGMGVRPSPLPPTSTFSVSALSSVLCIAIIVEYSIDTIDQLWVSISNMPYECESVMYIASGV